MFKRLIWLLLFATSNAVPQENLEISYDFSLNLGDYRVFPSILFLSSKESLFIWGRPQSETIEDTETEFSVDWGEKDSVGNFNYTDKVRDTLYSRQLTLNAGIIVVKEVVPKIEWKITEEVKKIGPLLCQKAETSFRGRNYTAWFAREIPISSGPWKLQGLPGLIIMVFDDTGEVRFSFKSIKQIKEFSKPGFGDIQELSLEEYEEKQRSVAKDLVRQIMSKMPRDVEITISKPQFLEYFD